MSGAVDRLGALVLLAAYALLFACEEAPIDGIEGVPELDQLDQPTRSVLAYAVMSTDRTVTSIGLLRADGTVLREAFVHSGSARAELATALSGDVVLPTRSSDRDQRTLTLIDRYRTDVITRIDVQHGAALGQLRAYEPDPSAAAWSSNPHDFLDYGYAPSIAWVTRFNPNPSVPDGDPEAGSDLIAIDPDALVRRDERIDLRALDTTAEHENPDSGELERVRAYARPSRMLGLRDFHGTRFAVVGLARASLAYDAFGPGAVALVDLVAQQAVALELPGLSNCTEVTPIAGDGLAALVSCTGPLRSGTRREQSGLAIVELVDDALVMRVLWRASEHPDAALTVHGAISLGGSRVVAFAPGPSEAEAGREDRDALYLVDLESGEQTRLMQTEGSWVAGQGVYDAQSATLLVPDASTDRDGRPTAGVHRFDVEPGAAPQLRDTLTLHESLPPWQIAPL